MSDFCKDLLAYILDSRDVALTVSQTPADAKNDTLREALSPILTGVDRARATGVALWIIRHWGGIRAGNEQCIRNWSNTLDDYDLNKVDSFVREQLNTRISSWSKLLSFADQRKYAIFDSRTSFSLNYALKKVGDRRRFHMPGTRNGGLNRALQKSRDGTRHKRLGYSEYLQLLQCFVAHGCAPTILRAERILFANAPSLARRASRR